MATREQEFTEVRRLLGRPKEQRPSSDAILGGLFREEQFMLNQLNGTRKGWTVNSLQLTVSADTAEYALYSNDPTNTSLISGFGKAMFVYREMSENVIVPVGFTDYVEEFSNQQLDRVHIPLEAGGTTSQGREKLGFFRKNNRPYVRVFPIPDESRVYKIVYASGALNWSSFTWSDEPILPEWSHYRCLKVASALLEDCEWTGNSKDDNLTERDRRGKNLLMQLQDQREEYEDYIRDPQQGPSIETVDAFYGGF